MFKPEPNQFLADGCLSTKEEINYDSELELWRSFKAGRESAFILIYKKYVQQLYNYGGNFTSNQELLKDCLQDFFIDLRKRRSRISDTTSIKFYLYKSFKRRVIEYLQKKQKKSALESETGNFITSIQLSPEEVFISNQTKILQKQKLALAMKKLSKKEQEAIWYYFYEGLSYQEIAELLKFNQTSSARRIIYNALSQLRSRITIINVLLFSIAILA